MDENLEEEFLNAFEQDEVLEIWRKQYFYHFYTFFL